MKIECYSCGELVDTNIKNDCGDYVCEYCFGQNYENNLLYFNRNVTRLLFDFDLTTKHQLNRLLQSYECNNIFELLYKIMVFLDFAPTPQESEFINLVWQINFVGKRYYNNEKIDYKKSFDFDVIIMPK